MGETLYRKGGCADMEKRMEDEKIIQLGLRDTEKSRGLGNYLINIITTVIVYHIGLSMMKRMPCEVVVLTIRRFGHGMPSRRNGRQDVARFSGKDPFEICR